jgi:hypothetical protein
VKMMGFGNIQYRHSPGSYSWLRNASRNRLLLQPPAALIDEKCLLPIRNLRIPPISEIFGIRLKIKSQRTLDPEPRAPLSTCSVHRPKPRQRVSIGQNYAD